MHTDDLSSDSGFIAAEEPLLSNEFSNIELLHSNPTTHSELWVATRLGKRFILKALKKEFRTNSLYRGMLVNEFDIGYSLSHKNIAQTLSCEYVEGLGDVIIIEYVDGVTLQQILQQGKLSPSTTQKIFEELCDALHYMHSLQVIHRDIKPENIMLTHNGQNLKLIDFGLACIDSQTLFKQPAGTRRYASPELLNGESIDNRSDIYALGVIISLLARNARHRRVAKRCLSYERGNRYVDALTVKHALMPSKLYRYIPIAMLLLLIVGSAGYAGYRYGVTQGHRVEVIHTETIKEVVDSVTIKATLQNTQRIEQAESMERMFSALCQEIDREVNAELQRHYAQLDKITSKAELSAHSMRTAGFVDEFGAKAAKRVDKLFGSNCAKGYEYKQILRSRIDNLWSKYLQDNSQRQLDAIERITRLEL